MIVHYLILKVLYLAWYIDAAISTQRVSGIDIHRIPDPQEVLDLVFRRLEKKRQAPKEVPITSDSNCDSKEEEKPDFIMPTENVHVRKLRKLISQVPLQKHYPICHLERTIRRLTTQVYEYRPAFYEEVKCVPEIEPYEGEATVNNEICTSLGFSCIQLNKTIHLTRRRYDNDCWESKNLVINAGCECMWPAQHLGDIQYHMKTI